jgi:nucleotide-binding universal stress UspA family protein
MSDWSEQGAVPVEDAATEHPPTADEVRAEQRRQHDRPDSDPRVVDERRGAAGHALACQRIVVLVDLDERIDAALDWGAALSHALHTPLTLFVPDEIDSAEKPPGEREDEIDRTTDDADAWAHRLGVDVDAVRVVVGDVDRALIEQSSDHDIVVTGVSGAVGFTRLALGAEEHGLARQLECPLVVVPARHGRQVGPIIADLGGHADESAVLGFATAVGRAMGREVLTSPQAGRSADPAEMLRSCADEQHASMVVTSTKPEHVLGGRLVGRVADDLLHEPPCPVVIVPAETAEQT